MRKYCLPFFFCICSQLCLGQLSYYLEEDVAYITQTEAELAKATSDSAKGYLAFKLSIYCRMQNDTVKANRYYDMGMASALLHPFLNAISYYYKAHALTFKSDINGAETNLLKGDSLLSKFQHKDAYTVEALIWHTYGTLQQMKGAEKKAMDAFVNKALPFALKCNDSYVLGNVQRSVATVFMNAQQWDKSVGYLKDAKLNVQQSIDKNPARWKALTEVCIISAENYVHLKQFDSAWANLNMAKSILARYPKSHLYLSYYCAEGACLSRMGRYAEGVESCNKGIALGKGGPTAVQYAVNRLKSYKYEALFDGGNYRAAVDAILDILQSPLLFEQDQVSCYEYLYKSYTKLGNMAAAFKWSERYIALTDSLHKKEVEKSITELETKYNNAEKEKKILVLEVEKEKTQLTAKNNRIVILLLAIALIFLLALAILGFLLHRNSKKLAAEKETSYRQQLTEVKQQQQLQLAQALLKGEERERKRLAGDLHDGLGGMLAGVKISLSKLPLHDSGEGLANGLSKSIKQLDGSINELRRIARNLMPETLLNLGLEAALKDLCEYLLAEKTKISFQAFNIRADLRQDFQLAIYRIVQELLANAVRHAKANQILVQCSQNEAKFFITVEDDGQGFDTNKTSGWGIGLSNVRSRVQYFNGDMEVETGQGQGSTINIELDINE